MPALRVCHTGISLSLGVCICFVEAGQLIEVLEAVLVMSPLPGSGDILFFPVHLSVCPSVCPSVRHKSCPLYNLKTVEDFSMKFGTLVNHDEMMCHAQEP